MLRILLVCLFLVGCGGSGSRTNTVNVVDIQTEPLQCRSVFYGDSIGRQLRDSVYAPDFDYYVTRGLMITEQGPLDDSYCTIYLELGTNIDWPAGKEAEELALINLIAGIEDKVICVLPMAQGKVPKFYHMRDMMKEHCLRIIDPAQEGVAPMANDGTHLSWGTDNPNLEHYARLFPTF